MWNNTDFFRIYSADMIFLFDFAEKTVIFSKKM